MSAQTDGRRELRARIVDAAAALLREQGAAAVTTRGVAEAAGVQAPAIYRLFGDKDGLLDAVAEHVMATYVAAKAATVRAAQAGGVDPLQDLREGWLLAIEFGVSNPALFAILSDPLRGQRSTAALAGRQVLQARVRRVAATGRLRLSEARAVGLISAAGTGAVLTILSMPPEDHDPGLAAAMFEAVMAQMLTGAPERADWEPLAAAVALRAVTSELAVLTGSERQLLGDWLDRVVASNGP